MYIYFSSTLMLKSEILTDENPLTFFYGVKVNPILVNRCCKKSFILNVSKLEMEMENWIRIRLYFKQLIRTWNPGFTFSNPSTWEFRLLSKAFSWSKFFIKRIFDMLVGTGFEMLGFGYGFHKGSGFGLNRIKKIAVGF